MRTRKHRAWHKEANQMLYAESADIFKWQKEEQPIEIMDFVGLTDKNGKEIYEGDIMRYERAHGGIECTISEVEARKQGITLDWFDKAVLLWHNEESAWIYRDVDDITDMTYHGNSWSAMYAKTWEVIGNIYEHPHLLKTP